LYEVTAKSMVKIRTQGAAEYIRRLVYVRSAGESRVVELAFRPMPE
jgi:hypothetical protein